MKQLLIVNSTKALNATKAGSTISTPYDFSTLAKGAIAFFELGATGLLSGPATKNFGIAVGRGDNVPAFVIPEVDINTLSIIHTYPYEGKKFSATFTFPTAVVGKEYTVVLVKKGVVPNERNLFTTSIVAGVTTAATCATALANAINSKTNDMFNVSASVATAAVTITANDYTDYEIKFADSLSGTNTTGTPTHAKKPIGDKDYILELAQKCAADKGFVYLDQASKDIYPGYPEEVEGGWTMNDDNASVSGASSTGYKIFNLRFATKREAGKTGDEQVWQYVHIAIPLTKADGSNASEALSSLNAILPEGQFNAVKSQVPVAATDTAPGTGYLTKAVADDLYEAATP